MGKSLHVEVRCLEQVERRGSGRADKYYRVAVVEDRPRDAVCVSWWGRRGRVGGSKRHPGSAHIESFEVVRAKLGRGYVALEDPFACPRFDVTVDDRFDLASFDIPGVLAEACDAALRTAGERVAATVAVRLQVGGDRVFLALPWFEQERAGNAGLAPLVDVLDAKVVACGRVDAYGPVAIVDVPDAAAFEVARHWPAPTARAAAVELSPGQRSLLCELWDPGSDGPVARLDAAVALARRMRP